jgi:hypothetical protein
MRPIIVTPRRALEQADKHRKFLADWKAKLAQHQIDKESRTSVQFGFSSTIAGGKYDYQCNAY